MVLFRHPVCYDDLPGKMHYLYSFSAYQPEYAVSCLNHLDNHDAFLVNEFFNENSYLLIYEDNKYPHLVWNPLWIWPPFGFFDQMGDEYGGYDHKKNLAWIIEHINDSGTIYRF